MPKRAHRHDLEAMKVEKIPCVALGPKHAPVPIPLITERGVTCVPLNSTADWLAKIVGIGCRGGVR